MLFDVTNVKGLSKALFMDRLWKHYIQKLNIAIEKKGN